MVHTSRGNPLTTTVSPEPAVGKKSRVEQVKEESRNLRGDLGREAASDEPRFSGDTAQLLKFHGVYQQEDRDVRKAARDGAADRSYIFMIRTKLPGGRLTAEQYLAFDDLADRYANGTLRITTRQDFQFHGVIKRRLKTSIRAINDALVTTLGACGDIERNVVTCSAPVGDAAHRAVQALAVELSDALLPVSGAYHEIWLNGERIVSSEPEGEPLYGRAYLPRKFKTGIGLAWDNCIDLHSNDLGFLPVFGRNGLEGVNVFVGGGLGMTHGMTATFPRLADAMAFVTPDQAIETAKAVIAVYRDHGDRANRKHARIKYLIEEWGIARFTAAVQERLPFSLQPPRETPVTGIHDHLGWQRQESGRWYLGVHVPNGRIADIDGRRMRSALRELVARYRPGVHLTAQQNILFSGFDNLQRAEVDALLRGYGVAPVEEMTAVRRFALACPAMPTCGLAVSESERVMPQLLDDLERRWTAIGLRWEPLVVRMTGCPNGCSRPYVAEIGIVGRSGDLYNIYLGGNPLGTRLNTLFAEIVPFHQLGSTLEPLFAAYCDLRRDGEGFGDFCTRLGVENLAQLSRQVAVSR